MGCECSVPRSFGSKKEQGKSFSFGPWNPSKLYSNDEKVQDFVYYNNALYAYINEDEPSMGQDPRMDTQDGVQTGKYWLQLFYQPEVDYGNVRFKTDTKGYLKISYDGGDEFGYLLDDSGNRISVKVGQRGDDGRSTTIGNIEADMVYCPSLKEPRVEVEEFGDKWNKDIYFHFYFPVDVCGQKCTVTVETDPEDADVEINGVITNQVTVDYGTKLYIVVRKDSCGEKEACYTATKSETILIRLR